MKKTGFNGYAYDFSVDYEVIAVDDIKDIHKYCIVCIKCFCSLKNVFLLEHYFYQV